MSASPDPYERRAQQLRTLAALHRKRAAELDRTAAATMASRSMRRLAELLTEAEMKDLAAHPDLAELNAQLEGFYGDEPENPAGERG
ncbi:hypothetical protein [Streptomyces beijiangensis]|uniref:Uncharacterized protein n=1 Tax=Streptomyces beijiangensis TaxID=163361 RepID=A0A939FCL7_9ACTN|nr:hypothetical protein [Streptomyces beijiangensis]MBO0516148.1 hypothetical protein [Streptomyces beijiangensis]